MAEIAARPVEGGERYETLDLLRGVAVLGILVMNIAAFSMPTAAYTNPKLWGGFTGADFWVWALTYTFASEKFLSLFSVLFGAGVYLMTTRLAGQEAPAGRLHFRRMGWLALFGLAHGYLLWFGDILFDYAICGVALYPFRSLPVRRLLLAAVLFFTVGSLVGTAIGLSVSRMPEEARREIAEDWSPPTWLLEDEVAAHRGAWFAQLEYRLPTTFMLQTTVLGMLVFWKATGLMLLGIALMKSGILTGEAATSTYRRLLGWGFGLGLPLVLAGVAGHLRTDFSFDYSMFLGSQPNYWGSVLLALAYLSGTVLLWRAGRLGGLGRALGATGRMAFTNYLMQSVICTTLFYGQGFGLFGALSRWQQMVVVLVVWVFQLAVSPLWLRHFRFGPAEWLWRSLTYRRLQPFRRIT